MRNKFCHLMGLDIVSQPVLWSLDSFGTTSTKFIFHLRLFKTIIQKLFNRLKNNSEKSVIYILRNWKGSIQLLKSSLILLKKSLRITESLLVFTKRTYQGWEECEGVLIEEFFDGSGKTRNIYRFLSTFCSSFYLKDLCHEIYQIDSILRNCHQIE